MRIVGPLRKLVGTPLRRKLTREAVQFLQCTADCRKIQRAVLRRLLKLNGESRFARSRGLDRVSDVATFRQAVPITVYDDYASHIEQLKRGDLSALLGPDNRLLMFSLTSGTTSSSKFIPVTSTFLRDYRRGWQIWGVRTFNDHPKAHCRNIVQINSDHHRFETSGGIPCGNISGLAAAMQRKIVRLMYSVPNPVVKIADPEAKYYAALRFAVADDNVGMITTANPGTLIRLAVLGDAAKDDLIRDIHDGTLSDRYNIEPAVRQRLARRLAVRRRKRAGQLERIVETTGHLYPRDYWAPNAVLAVWTGGSCGAYLRLLHRYFGDMPIRDHGLSASEGRMTVPIQDRRSEGILEITTHFFEFVPEAEYGSERPTVLESHELQAGANYYILLTTSSGFYRYDICDVVQCVGFHGTTPLLKFLHKGSHISSITGEKLAESQTVDAVTAAVQELGLRLEQFSVVPVWGEPPSYRLLIEQRDAPTAVDLRRLSTAVEARLQQLNCEYREKRVTGRLDGVQTVLLRDGAWRGLLERRTATMGGSVEQYKHPCLIPDLKTAADFLDEFAVVPTEQSLAPSPGVARALGLR